MHPNPATTPDAGRERVEDLLREVMDRGLIYWEPNTARGHDAKASVIARCERALAALPPPEPARDLSQAAADVLAERQRQVDGRSLNAWQFYWRLLALHEARMRMLRMVVQQERARSGQGKAWNGQFYADQLALLSKEDLEPCMECRGTGCEVDPETGPGACPHCGGDGVFVPFTNRATSKDAPHDQ